VKIVIRALHASSTSQGFVTSENSSMNNFSVTYQHAMTCKPLAYPVTLTL
jgi:hypothetical protein